MCTHTRTRTYYNGDNTCVEHTHTRTHAHTHIRTDAHTVSADENIPKQWPLTWPCSVQLVHHLGHAMLRLRCWHGLPRCLAIVHHRWALIARRHTNRDRRSGRERDGLPATIRLWIEFHARMLSSPLITHCYAAWVTLCSTAIIINLTTRTSLPL